MGWFRSLCGTIRRALAKMVRKETLLNLHKVMVIPLLLCGCETQTLRGDQMRVRSKAARDVRILR